MTNYVISDEGMSELDKYFIEHNDSLIKIAWKNLKDKHIRYLSDEIKKERECILDLFEVCLQQEGFLVLDQDEPVVSIPDVKKLIDALRSGT